MKSDVNARSPECTKLALWRRTNGPCDLDETWQSDRARGPAGLRTVMSPNQMGRQTSFTKRREGVQQQKQV